ncbi:MAG: glycosyltransferase family 4 protein [Syntrophobacteraceae bacterium]|nr:glycosyltransferase family 4 protein [Syntrophobacteraceae bacterium]
MSSPVPGTVILFGPVYQRSGYGVAARSFVMGFYQAGLRIKVVPVDCNSGAEPGLDDYDHHLMRSLELTEVISPVTAIFCYVPTYVFPKLSLPEPNVRIMLTTFASNANSPLPPPRLIFICNRMDQVWLANEIENRSWIRAGLNPELVQPIIWPHMWVENRVLPPVYLQQRTPDRKFRFLHISLLLPRRRLDALIEAFFEEFRDEPSAELYLKISYPTWHPIPEKPQKDLRALIDGLVGRTGSKASIILDDSTDDTRSEIAMLYDSCDFYVSTDTTNTAPVSEAILRLRPAIITDGWGVELPDELLVIPNSERQITITPGMAEYMPQYRDTSFPALELPVIRRVLRQAFDMNSKEREWRARAGLEFIRARYSFQVAIPGAVAAITKAWEKKSAVDKKEQDISATRSSVQGKTEKTDKGKYSILWSGLQLAYGSLPRTNRNICLRLMERGHTVSIMPSYGPFWVEELSLSDDPDYCKLADKFYDPLPSVPNVYVTHAWDPVLQPSPKSHFVFMSCWKYGSIPVDWLDPLRKMVDEIWVPSTYVRNGFIQSGVPAEQVQVIPLGVDVTRFNPLAQPYPLKTRKRFKFLFVGETYRRKGFDLVLKAFRENFKKSDDVCLVVKDIDSSEFYRHKPGAHAIKSCRLHADHPEIEYLDFMLKDEEMPGLYTACDCLVAPSKASSFGLAIAEAMACGLPVIVTQAGPALDFCNIENAYFLPARQTNEGQRQVGAWKTAHPPTFFELDPIRMGQVMRYVVKNPDLAKRKGTAGAKHIRENFDWNHSLDAIEHRIRLLCKKPIRHMNITEAKVPATPQKVPENGNTNISAVPGGALGSGGTLVWVAPFYNRSGYGVGARAFVTALHEAGVRIRTIPVDGSEPGIDDCNLELIGSLEKTPIEPPVTAIFSHVPHQLWVDMVLPRPHKKILATTFDSSAQGNVPPQSWIEICKEMDQVWLMSEKEKKAFLKAGLPEEKLSVVTWPHHWMSNPYIPLPSPPARLGGRPFRFLSIAMFLPRRRWNILLRAYFEEFSQNENVQLYLKVNYPSWHPDPGQPRVDLLELVESLRRTTNSKASVIIDDNLGTRSELVNIVDGCDVYVSTDVTLTAPVGEAMMRQRLAIIVDGWGSSLPDEQLIVIAADPNAKEPFTPDMLKYQPHHKGSSMPVLNVADVRRALRRAFDMPIEERQNRSKTAFSQLGVVYDSKRSVADAMTQMAAVWRGGTQPGITLPVRRPKRIIWEGSQFVNNSAAHINRELCHQLLVSGEQLSIIPFEPSEFAPEVDPRFSLLANRFYAPLAGAPDVHVRHHLSPIFTPPPQGHWVMVHSWEYGRLPEGWIEPMTNLVDEIWVPGRHVQKACIASGIPADRVIVVPNGVNPDMFKPIDRKRHKKFRFLFTGGALWRKGIDILLRAYLEAFTKNDNAILIVKDSPSETHRPDIAAARLITDIRKNGNSAEIIHYTQVLDVNQRLALYHACDCVVHPYRAEGLGLSVMESMACGIPVITTTGGASDDFCSPENAYLIPSRRVDFAPYDIPLAGGAGWVLEPDVEALTFLLREVYKNRDSAQAKAARASEFIRSHYSWESIARKVRSQVEVLIRRPVLRENKTEKRPLEQE